MSVSDAFQKLSFGDYHADQLLRYFNIPPDREAAAQALRYMFKVMCEETPMPGMDLAHRNRRIAEIAIEKIQFRYNLYMHYREFFFPSDYKPDDDALAMAVICDEYINHANAPTGMEDGEMGPPRNDGLNDDVLGRACILWEEACTLEALGLPEDDEELPSLESVFLAHINVFENLKEIETGFDAYEDDELVGILKKTFPPAQSFLYPHTLIGEDLGGYLGAAEDAIKNRLYPPLLSPPPPRKRPALVLVKT